MQNTANRPQINAERSKTYQKSLQDAVDSELKSPDSCESLYRGSYPSATFYPQGAAPLSVHLSTKGQRIPYQWSPMF